MTFQELQNKIGQQIESEWHQHKNGGGWVKNTATVDKTAFVSGNAHVCGDARVYGNAHVCGNAWVYGNAHVYDSARVCGDAHVCDSARVYGNAWLYGNAQVCGSAHVYGNAQVSGLAWVYGNAWETSPLFTTDSRGHGCSNCKHGWLKIGCEEHTFNEWQERFDAIAQRYNLTDDEKVEYRAIVDLFCKIGK